MKMSPLVKNIVLASNNSGKVKEFQALFSDINIKIIPQDKLNIKPIDENGNTFVANALRKARHAARQSGFAAIADDSGLCIDILNGAPGIYSARYAKTHGDDAANIAKVLSEMRNVTDTERSAHFHCCLVFVHNANDQQPIICAADWHGEILTTPKGKHGFGYDPIFYVPTHHCSAAQLDPVVKNRISHRGQAMQLLQSKLQPLLA